MKEVKVQRNFEKFLISDIKDIDGLLENIDRKLKEFSLELIIGDCGSDDILVDVRKK